jgi:DNA replicative helicase MCM subunit Mcm2 (Cdc46/Mcm family)
MSEQRITCADCGREFTFSAEEQAFFREKGFTPPKRCKSCRQAKKEQRENDGRGSRR